MSKGGKLRRILLLLPRLAMTMTTRRWTTYVFRFAQAKTTSHKSATRTNKKAFKCYATVPVSIYASDVNGQHGTPTASQLANLSDATFLERPCRLEDLLLVVIERTKAAQASPWRLLLFDRDAVAGCFTKSSRSARCESLLTFPPPSSMTSDGQRRMSTVDVAC